MKPAMASVLEMQELKQHVLKSVMGCNLAYSKHSLTLGHVYQFSAVDGFSGVLLKKL